VRQLAKRVLAVTVGIVAGLLLAEVALRVAALLGIDAGVRIARRDPSAFLYEPFGNFGYRERPGRHERYENGTVANFNAGGYRGPIVDTTKAPGTYRIVLLGGSTMFGYGVNDEDTIDAHMRRLLTARYPNRCFEVVNLALGGYDSYQDYERMRVDGARFTPDLVVLNSGINDVRNAQYARLGDPPDPRTLFWEPVMHTMREEARDGLRFITRAKHYSYLVRIPGYVKEVMGQRQGLTLIRATEPDGSAVEYFGVNVTRTIDLAAGVGAAVILSKPPSALPMRNRPSDPLEKSYWLRDAGTTEAYRQRLAVRMREIAERERAVGRRVRYVEPQLPLDAFLDDAHLNSAGNERMAHHFLEAAAPFIGPTVASAAGAAAACWRPLPQSARHE
jgi:lysophospholipase L1-like esterase